MTRSSLFLFRTLPMALIVLGISGCASIQQAVDKVRGGDEAAVETGPVEEKKAAPASEPTEPAAPKPPVRSRPAVQEKPKPVPAPAPAPAPPPAAPDIPGPAWLKRCASVQLAGGIVRCDADLLLAKPSPTVQVFTRDPKRVVEGQIRLRSGLPRVYRFYVVP